MTMPIIIVAAMLVLAVAVCARNIRRLSRDVATLYATRPPATETPSDTDTRLRALEAAERRRQQSEAERSHQ